MYVFVSVCFFNIVYPPHYANSDKKGIESAVGKTGQNVKWQIKWLGLSMRLVGTQGYSLSKTFQCL